MKKNNTRNYTVTKNISELTNALGINQGEIALIEYKIELSKMAKIAIEKSELSMKEVKKHSGITLEKIRAIKNGALAGISCEQLIKVISATGFKLTIEMTY
jgi:hypothetical protein